MLDIQYIRENPKRVAEFSQQKGYEVDIDQVLKYDQEKRQLLAEVEQLRKTRNELVESAKGTRPSEENIQQGREIRSSIEKKEKQLKELDVTLWNLLKAVPNVPADDVPVGVSEDENQVIKTAGEVRQFDFEVKSHWQLAESKEWIDKERAAKVAGSRFAYLRGELVQLQFAIVQFTLDTLTNEKTLAAIAKEHKLSVSAKPFIPILPPAMIRTDVYEAMDRLEPKDDRYRVGEPNDNLWLQGSAEHTIGSMFMDEILPKAEFPLRFVGYLTSFRREAGTYGKDTEGIFRMHQFDKLEMESFTSGNDGLQEHYFLCAIQEYLVSQLGLPYQVILKCTADIGKPNARGIDINTWFPAQQKYRETHTADYMTDYQARRLKTRVRGDDDLVELVHTNDATAFALGRTMAAILENYQTQDGGFDIPTVLVPYMKGRS